MAFTSGVGITSIGSTRLSITSTDDHLKPSSSRGRNASLDSA
ncbi:MAG: hypothetical protein Q8L14_13560 [Myxococcales bacterium]|nr:hypothetical protein [Myxococcales bacterium]